MNWFRIWVRKFVRNICIVDRFLLLYMLILFIYLVFHIFTGTDTAQESNTIDIIVRTSIAAIFGYFISSNFGSTNHQNLSIQSTEEKEPLPYIESVKNVPENSETRCSKIQVIIVATIGFLSLIILFITRFFQDVTPELAVMISQLRDFVSACIGFLISCGKDISD